MFFAILKNEFDNTSIHWENACKKHNVNYKIIDLTKSEWLNEILNSDFNALLACPPGRESIYKQLYDERIYILEKDLKQFVFPSYKEISIHENKRFLSYWLKANNIKHPETFVFYNKKEALSFANKIEFPIVGKFNIGASGKGVEIIREKDQLIKYINTAFSKGLRQNWGPNLKMGDFKSRIIKVIKKPSHIINRVKVYRKTYNEIQRGFILLQKFIPHSFEWRIVKIGNFYFGHQKIKQGDKASGTKGINYVLPPNKLLYYVKDICEKHHFNSMAVDLFEDEDGGYLINELQCVFGHVQKYICEKDKKPGRILYSNEVWGFEEGLFNSNLSYDLRLEYVIEEIKNK